MANNFFDARFFFNVKFVGFLHNSNANNSTYLIELFQGLTTQIHVKDCNSSATQNFGYPVLLRLLKVKFLTMSVM